MKEQVKDQKGGKDAWDKAKSLGPIFIPVVLLILGLVADNRLAQRKEMDARVRMYGELLASREKADSDLRMNMFSSIINEFLRENDPPNIGDELLHLELLAYNFHESINISPLFGHMRRKLSDHLEEIGNPSCQELRTRRYDPVVLVNNTVVPMSVATDMDPEIEEEAWEYCEYKERLDDIAKEICYKQSMILEQLGTRWQARVPMEATERDTIDLFIDDTVTFGEHQFDVMVDVTGVDKRATSLIVELTVDYTNLLPQIDQSKLISAQFSLDFYDFPLINNTRLPGNHRCAVVLDGFHVDDGFAEISLYLFSGEFAALTEKTYMRELIDKVLKPNEDASLLSQTSE